MALRLSEMYLVESNIADIISISYSTCESSEGAGGNSFNNQLFEQAAAQGISVSWPPATPVRPSAMAINLSKPEVMRPTASPFDLVQRGRGRHEFK